MLRNIAIIAVTAAVVALPFIFRREEEASDWQPGNPVLVVISPHNEAIRYEFGHGFARWHARHYGEPVKVDWRVIGGTTEIIRYLQAEYVASFRAWWMRTGRDWPTGGGDMILDRRFNAGRAPSGDDPAALAAWERQRELHAAFRNTDEPDAFTCKIDLFFGGGTYDHGAVADSGISVEPWPPDNPPPDTLTAPGGGVLIPEFVSGEVWRSPHFIGNALSTFGICYNLDRLADLGVEREPRRWEDLTDPAYFGQVGAADPTKSGSIAKAFEMIVQQQCLLAVRAAGFSDETIAAYEDAITAARLPPGELPPGIPPAYQAAVEAGWLNGVRLIQRIGANARYFTDAATKVPIDVSAGDAAVGLAIDFYGRYQAETSRGPDGAERMVYVTPEGGSSVSADPISLLRGAPRRELAVRFIAYVLSEDGQILWNYAPGTPGGPIKFALRRLPIRRDFYPAGDGDGEVASHYARHAPHLVDELGRDDVNPYVLAEAFVYYPRWTGRHFGIQRDLIRVMCLDAGTELRAAWKAILDRGGPDAQPEAMALLSRLPDRPEPLSWAGALSLPRRHARLDYMREWTLFFRASYAEARERAGREPG